MLTWSSCCSQVSVRQNISIWWSQIKSFTKRDFERRDLIRKCLPHASVCVCACVFCLCVCQGQVEATNQSRASNCSCSCDIWHCWERERKTTESTLQTRSIFGQTVLPIIELASLWASWILPERLHLYFMWLKWSNEKNGKKTYLYEKMDFLKIH